MRVRCGRSLKAVEMNFSAFYISHALGRVGNRRKSCGCGNGGAAVAAAVVIGVNQARRL